MLSTTKSINVVGYALVLLVIVPLLGQQALPENAVQSKRLIAYYLYQDQTRTPAYTAKQIPFKKLTHLIHVALVVDPSGDGSIQISPHAIEASLIPKAHAAGVRVLVCVQGSAAAFSKAAANPETRSRFAQNVKNFILKYSYDGVDIDWEVPESQAEVANNVLLMQSLRAALPFPRYLVSMATPSEPGHWGEFDFAHLTPILDFYNVMTYDFHGPWTKHAGHNSPLFSNENDPGHDGSIDDSMNLYLNKLGVPPEKINLGTAFYGYEFPAGQLHTPCDCEKTTASREYGTYIKPRIGKEGWVQAVDPVAMAPYLVHSNAAPGFITYDDADSTARKVVYALDVRNLGGVFMWELSEDYDGKKQDLLDSMYQTFKRMKKHGD
ncbi:MAG: glycoside hydrolase family 18 protein [Terracidiphilus sp.]|jgi:chitinase